MNINVLVTRISTVTSIAVVIALLLSSMTPSQGTRALATGGLPTAVETLGLFSEAAFLRLNPEIQTAYVAGVLDALIAVLAEGEAFAEAGLDPRNAYGIVYEAVAGIPEEIPLETLSETILKNIETSASENVAAIAIWRLLALSHCCWGL